MRKGLSLMVKLKHWRGFQAIYAWKASPVLEFAFLRTGYGWPAATP